MSRTPPPSPDRALDPNVTPARPDLAAAGLEGRVAAERFVEGVSRRVARGSLPLRGRPDAAAPWTSELLHGEGFTVYEERDGWAWGQSAVDSYVGYAPADGLGAPGPQPTHRVAALRALVLPEPEVKAPPIDALSLLSPVAVVGRQGRFARLAGGGWIAAAALGPLDDVAPDFAATAARFLGVPYLWGGRGSLGLDCSGLVQIALRAAGHPAPRDSYMQRDQVGEDPGLLPADGFARGDIVFLPGHVGILTDPATLIHANAWTMDVAREPLEAVAARSRAADGAGVTAVRRLPGEAGHGPGGPGRQPGSPISGTKATGPRESRW